MMCGRYTRFAATELIYQHFGIPLPRPVEATDAPPNWNVAPQSNQPVIRISRETGQRELVVMRWGLVPYWAKTPAHNFSTINAKAETLLEKPAFREPFRQRRCLVPVNSYFEWQVVDAKSRKKQAWAIGLKSEKPFALGGIWDLWKSQQGVRLESYAIVTTETNELLAPLHDRMPLIIDPRDYDRWLALGDSERPPVDLLRPYDSEQMKMWRVKPDVGNVKNDRPDLLEPYEPPDDPDPSTLF